MALPIAIKASLFTHSFLLIKSSRNEGQSESATARQLGTNRKTVRLWRTRFAAQGLQSLWEVASGRGRKPTYGPEKIKAIVDATLQTKPRGMTQWSCRRMA